jgi:hypothetical protein
MSTTPLQEELLALIGRLEVVAVELIAAQVHLDNASLDAREASKAPEAKARMRSLMDALEWLGSERRKLITRQEEVG